MKKLIAIMIAVSFGCGAYAQDVSLKDVSGMGQKKFKKAAKKVYIAEFRVMYQLLFSQTEVAEGGREIGGGYRGDAGAGLNMAVKGISESDLKEITNTLYNDYVQMWKDAGFEIITADEAAKTKELEGHEKVSGGTLSEDQAVGLLSSTPDNYEYLVGKITNKGKEKAKFNGYKLSADLDGAIVAQVNIVVPFIVDAESGISKGLTKTVGGVAKIVVMPDLRIESDIYSGTQTKMNLFFAEKRVKPESASNLMLKKDLDIPDVMEEKKYKSSESADSDNWGTNYGAISVFNVSDKYMSKTHAIEVDAEKYKAGVIKAGNAYLKAAADYLFEYSNK